MIWVHMGCYKAASDVHQLLQICILGNEPFDLQTVMYVVAHKPY